MTDGPNAPSMRGQSGVLCARGFTLIELVMFIVIVSVGLAGILSVMNTTVLHTGDPVARKQINAIAESMMEEITLKAFAKPTGSTVLGYSQGGARNLFDCVDDYNNYATTAGIVDLNNNPIAGLGSYNITNVVVSSTSDLAPLASASAKKITVMVQGPGGSLSLVGYRTLY